MFCFCAQFILRQGWKVRSTFFGGKGHRNKRSQHGKWISFTQIAPVRNLDSRYSMDADNRESESNLYVITPRSNQGRGSRDNCLFLKLSTGDLVAFVAASKVHLRV